MKNRRYAAMKELEAGGVYFSEDEMKHREPLLYEQMIGQFLTEEEQQQQATDGIDRSDLRLSTILLHHLDDVQRKALYEYQKEKEVRVFVSHVFVSFNPGAGAGTVHQVSIQVRSVHVTDRVHAFLYALIFSFIHVMGVRM